MAVSTIKMDSQLARFINVGWGTSISKTISSQALFIGNTGLYVIWFASTSNIAVLKLLSGSSPTAYEGAGSVTVGTFTFTRNGSTLTVTSTTYSAMKIIS